MYYTYDGDDGGGVGLLNDGNGVRFPCDDGNGVGYCGVGDAPNCTQ